MKTELEKKYEELVIILKGYTNLLKDAFDLLANNNLIKEDKRKFKITDEFSELVNKGAEAMSSSLRLESEIAALKQQGEKECGHPSFDRLGCFYGDRECKECDYKVSPSESNQDKEQISAEKDLRSIISKHLSGRPYEPKLHNIILAIAEEYAQQGEVTDEMIERYAKSFPGNTRNQIIDAGVTAGFITGAKAMRDNKIK